jgi:hypothetical protein
MEGKDAPPAADRGVEMVERANGVKVYIIEQQPFDYTPATMYGELQFLKAARLAPHAPNAPNTWNRSVINELSTELNAYMPGVDYIIPTGSPVRMMLAGMVLAHKGRQHKFLKWDTRSRRYLEFVIEL